MNIVNNSSQNMDRHTNCCIKIPQFVTTAVRLIYGCIFQKSTYIQHIAAHSVFVREATDWMSHIQWRFWEKSMNPTKHLLFTTLTAYHRRLLEHLRAVIKNKKNKIKKAVVWGNQNLIDNANHIFPQSSMFAPEGQTDSPVLQYQKLQIWTLPHRGYQFFISYLISGRWLTSL